MLAVSPDPVPLAEPPRGHALKGVHQRRDGHLGRVLDQQVHVVVLAGALCEHRAEVLADFPEHLGQVPDHLSGEHTAPVLSHEDQVDVQRGDDMPATPVLLFSAHRPTWYRELVAVRDRLYPIPAHVPVLTGHCGDARFVWNLCVEQQSWWRPGRGNGPGAAERQRQLAEARKAELWLGQGSSSVQQQALRDYDRAMAAFFDPENPAGKPSYRSKHGAQGFVIRDTRIRRVNKRWGEVHVPKCGYVRFRWTRDLPEKPGMARVTLDRTGRWHVSFTAPQPAVDRQPTGAVVGIDRGVRTALVTSDGHHYRAPRISDRRAARYLALQRKLSRQQKGSRKREKTRLAMARIAAGVADRRKDWAEKVSTRLVIDRDLVVFEKLNTKGMTRKPKPKPDPEKDGAFLPNRRRQKAGLNRGILASCWGALATRTDQKAAASGALVAYVNPKHTSQECRECHHVAKENRDSQAVFRCMNCGHEDHADRNAARNVLARGLAALAVPCACPGARGIRPRKTVKAAAGTTPRAA
jgi:putative transposase